MWMSGSPWSVVGFMYIRYDRKYYWYELVQLFKKVGWCRLTL
jgi:hypothetical protein